MRLELGRTTWVVAVSALLACGDDTASGGAGGSGGGGGEGGGSVTSQRYQSGSRLKVVVSRSGDAEQFSHVIDSELADVRCEPLIAEDGAIRCVPYGNGEVFYLDAACTQPVMVHFPNTCADGGPTSYVSAYEYAQEGCGVSLTARSYRAGSAITSPPATVFQKDPTSCYETTVGGELYELEELGADELVALDEVTEPRGDDLELRFYESDDGFRLMQSAPRDVARNVECYPGELGSATVCVPSAPSGKKPAYSDDTCTTEVASGAVSYESGCSKPTLSYVSEPDSADMCTSTSHVFEVGADSAEAYGLFGPENCSLLGGVDTEYALLGAQIPDDDFPAVEQVDEGTGPIRLRTHYAAGGPITPYGQWVTDGGAPCYPYAFADGEVRCGPPTRAFVPPPEGTRYFADDACTELLVEIYDDPCFDVSALGFAVVAGGGQCGGFDVRVLGEAHSGAIFTQSGGPACFPATATDSAAYHRVGEPAPLDQFGLITTETL